MSITVYTFEGPRDNPYTGEYTTQDYQEADRYASVNGYRLIANEYEWADSEMIEDYTGEAEEEALHAALAASSLWTLADDGTLDTVLECNTCQMYERFSDRASAAQWVENDEECLFCYDLAVERA